MTGMGGAGSIRTRLIWQLLLVAAVLSALLYFSIRTVADTAVVATQDSILGAATASIADEMRVGPDGLEVDIAYSTFSILGAVGNDRIFYRILLGPDTVTGYDDLPLPELLPRGLEPIYYSARFLDQDIRVAAVSRPVLIGSAPRQVLVLIGQTQTARAGIVSRLTNRAALLGLGFFSIAAILSVLTARSVLKPISRLQEAVERRGPQDLRPVARPVPAELAPLVAALNGFIARLAAALDRTETFIAEAAHHIRTPLATLRAQSENALHQTEDEPTRKHLRSIIRAADDAARSAGQLLDHATVIYRTDQRSDDWIDMISVTQDVLTSMRPAADLRDITLQFEPVGAKIPIRADRLLVESAIRNLIDNAIKYSDPEAHVEIGLGSTDGTATLSVRDRGRGLGGMTAEGLTKRFSRGGNVGDVVGSGLGLMIVREVAAALGGRFSIRERDGGGTCADLSLPCS